MCYYKEKHPKIFLGAVVTDFTVHKWWLCNGVDAYFVADARLKEKITVPTQVQAFGIPLRQDFRRFDSFDYDACRKQYGWTSEERVCLVMGGGEGLLPMEEILLALQKKNIAGLRLVAITGNNAKLEQKLRERFAVAAGAAEQDVAGSATPIEIYGFRQDVPQLLAGADMIITKAGGLTCAEVLATGLELFIYKPLPGQERGNAAFLEQYYQAKVCDGLEQLVHAVAAASCQKGAKQGKKPLGNRLAAMQIAEFVLEKIKSK